MTTPSASSGRSGRLMRFMEDNSGAGAVEFAIIVPLLLVLYIGAVELSEAFTAKRKVESATSAVGDLVTRAKDIDAGTMTDILDWVPVNVLAPYPIDKGDTLPNPRITVTCVAIDGDEVATVKWSAARGSGGTDHAGSTIDLPAGVVLPDSKLVHVKVNYDYMSVFGRYVGGKSSGAVTLSSDFYFKPREANTVCYDGTCC